MQIAAAGDAVLQMDIKGDRANLDPAEISRQMAL